MWLQKQNHKGHKGQEPDRAASKLTVLGWTSGSRA